MAVKNHALDAMQPVLAQLASIKVDIAKLETKIDGREFWFNRTVQILTGIGVVIAILKAFGKI
jgi:hypothetical protein